MHQLISYECRKIHVYTSLGKIMNFNTFIE